MTARLPSRFFAGGRPKVEEIMAYFPALIPKSLIETLIDIVEV